MEGKQRKNRRKKEWLIAAALLGLLAAAFALWAAGYYRADFIAAELDRAA